MLFSLWHLWSIQATAVVYIVFYHVKPKFAPINDRFDKSIESCSMATSARYPISTKCWRRSFVGDWFYSLKVVRYYFVSSMVLRNLYSTVLAIIEITDYIKRLHGKKHYVISISINFKKESYTVDQGISLYKSVCYGIRGLANGFSWPYLTNSTQS